MVEPVELDEETLAAVVACFDVVRSGDSQKLDELLANGLPPNLTNDSGDTLLILAAYHAHPQCVRLLLEAGADHGRVNDRGQTALGCAVFRRDSEVVRQLLAAGADPQGGSPSAVAVANQFQLHDMKQLMEHR